MNQGTSLGMRLQSPSDHMLLWTEIYNRARQRGKVIETAIETVDFEYALLNSDDGLAELEKSTEGVEFCFSEEEISEAFSMIEGTGILGFGANKLAFVIEQNIARPGFADFVGFHQYVEANASTRQYDLRIPGQCIHGVACEFELREVLKQDPDFQEAYARMLLASQNAAGNPLHGYYGSAIPPFVKVIEEGTMSPIELMMDFKRRLDGIEHFDYYPPEDED